MTPAPHAQRATTPAHEEAPALELRAVSKVFGGEHALNKMDLDVQAGEVHALMGENGSGKSTLVKVLAGFHQPEPGATARVRGQPINLGHATDAHGAGIRFVHQELGLIDMLSAVDNMGLARGFDVRGGRIRWREEADRAREAIGRLGYGFDVTRPVGELMAAERTVVAIARALDEPEGTISILVLDEPTAALSGPEAERLFTVVESVRASGIGVILVSHHLEEVLGISDRLTVLRNGSRIGTFDKSSVNRQSLIELMTGRAMSAEPDSAAHALSVTSVLRARGLSGALITGMDLDLHPGEIVGVAGITGSGAEELPLLLYGHTPRAGGSLKILGHTMEKFTPPEAYKHGVGFVSGERLKYGVFPEFTMEETITIGDLRPFLHRGLLRRRSQDAEARRWIDIFAIRPAKPGLNILNLSGGNQQKALLAKALRVEPKILLLDDPTRGVDVGAKSEIHRLIDEVATKGAAVLLCSSDTEELARMCNRVLVMRRGAVARELRQGEIDAETITQLTL